MLEVLALALTVFLVVLSAAYAQRFGIGKEILLAGTRALVQILILASIILILFEKPLFWSFLVLAFMAAIAGHTTYSRSGKLERGLSVAIVSIAAASLLLLIPFFPDGNLPPGSKIYCSYRQHPYWQCHEREFACYRPV
ncbi:MAG: ABC transporter permease [Candidatus Methanoperedens sp.]|nr:ABC transporter permease [Candidatus Methanoperedens sp.]MCE8429177.1 ABC transporter permease [Candidatus Methanoperedens sp.]